MSEEQIMVSYVCGYFWAIIAQEVGYYCFWLPLSPSPPGSAYTAEWSHPESVFAGQSLDQVQPQFFSVPVEVHSCTCEWNLKIEIREGGIFLQHYSVSCCRRGPWRNWSPSCGLVGLRSSCWAAEMHSELQGSYGACGIDSSLQTIMDIWF